MSNESFTYSAKTSSKQKPNAPPPIFTPVTIAVQKWQLSNKNHKENKIENQIYPPPTSATPSTNTSSTRYTVAKNGMKAIKPQNGVSAEVKGTTLSGKGRTSKQEEEEAPLTAMSLDCFCNTR